MASVVGLSLGRWSCPLVAGLRAFWVVPSFRGVFPAFVPLRFCFPTIPAKYALFRILGGFLAGFAVFVGVCVVLVLCVACGAFVCVSG